jgi:hypothetical protein
LTSSQRAGSAGQQRLTDDLALPKADDDVEIVP